MFIGELCKQGMLNDKIVHECVIRKLLEHIDNPVAEDIEALCKLMMTIGQVLDSRSPRTMDVYFQRMVALSKHTLLPSRVRFLLTDVIELRENKWVEKKGAAISTAPFSTVPQCHTRGMFYN